MHHVILTLARRPVTLLACLLLACAGILAQPLRKAAQLDAEGKCDEAERLYRAALAEGAPSAALLNNAGNHYVVCGDSTRAQHYFEKLIGINPHHANANLQLARIVAGQKQGTKALEYLSRVTDDGPQVSLVRAEALHWAGQKSAASSVLDDLERDAARNPEILFLLGVTCARLGLYERAESVFTRALALRPGDFDITFGLGRTAARAQHYDRAQKVLEAALKIRPEAVEVLLELGRVCAARQDYVRAVFHLARARQKAPGNPDILLLLARAAEDAGYYDDAATAYDEYLQLRPNEDTVRRDRARAYGQTESRLQQARAEVAWYLAKHPNDPEAHYIAAQILWGTDPDDALRHLTEAVRLDPASVSIRFSRAWMLQRMGQMAESLPDLEAAHRLAPENARILDLIAIAHLALDRPSEAEKVLRLAIARAPNSPDVLLHMGRALMALGREAEAQTYLEKYRQIRPQALPGLRKRFGMIELATLTAAEQRRREIDRFRRESRDHPDRPDYQLHLSSLLLADGQKDEAMREFGQLLALNAPAQVCEEAGSLLLSSGEVRLAREFLERAVKERPSARLDLALAIFQADGAGPALAALDGITDGELAGDAMLLKANILEGVGRRSEAEQALAEGLIHSSTKPRIIERAAVLLVRLNRHPDAIRLLDGAMGGNPEQPDLLLLKGIVLGVTGQHAAAEATVRGIETSWPEWDRAYLVHGLLSEMSGRNADARRHLQTAAALGSTEPAIACALARLNAKPSPAPECKCATGLEQMMFNACAQ